jgi:hypothetical protein
MALIKERAKHANLREARSFPTSSRSLAVVPIPEPVHDLRDIVQRISPLAGAQVA